MAAGYFVSSGPALTRTGFGVVGIFIVMIATWFAIMLTNVIRGCLLPQLLRGT